LIGLKNCLETCSQAVQKQPIVFIVAMLCLVFALNLGILAPEIFFYRSSANVSDDEGTIFSAFATEDSVLVEIPAGKNITVRTIVQGIGNVKEMKLAPRDRDRIAWLNVNGNRVCGPCDALKKYPVDQNDALVIEMHIDVNAAIVEENQSDFFTLTPMFVGRKISQLVSYVELKTDGGWHASETEKIPSSFYFIDSPYHISKTNITADYLSKGSLPWSFYPVTSVIPPAVMVLLFGISAQYAYKIYLIILFFAPVVLFYLFSRKLERCRDSAFLFAVLFYLYIPMKLMLVGGGQDLFIDGMTARTLAIYLAMFFFYFAYEFVAERKNSLLPAVAFFFASFMTHPKGLLAPGIGIGMLCAYFVLRRHEWKRPALLLLSCCAVVFATGVYYAEVLLGTDLGSGGGLGGVLISKYEEGLVSFLTTSAFILPVFFSIGAYFAIRQKSDFAIWLLVFSAVVLVVSTNPTINTNIPSFDGLRHMPVFYLCAYFISGFGAAGFYSVVKTWFLSWVDSRRIDRMTAVGALVLAIGLPLTSFLFVVILSAPSQYYAPYLDLRIAKEYVALEKAGGIAGDERIAYVYESELSQYPIGVFGIVHPQIASCNPGNATSLYESMVREKVRYAVFGNGESYYGPGNGDLVHIGKYEEITGDTRFEVVVGEGSARLFRLVGHEDLGKRAYGNGTVIAAQEINMDRVFFAGDCKEENCSILFFSALSLNPKCHNSQGLCTVRKATDNAGWVIDGIVNGPFDIRVNHEPKEMEFVLFFAGGLVLLACFWLSGKIS